MHSMRCIFILCMTMQVFHGALSVSSASSYDASFEYDEDISPIKHIHPDPELRSLEHMMMREMADDDPDILTSSEERVRDALSRSIQDTRSRRTLSEMMPILRSLSDKQRLAFAALIASQTKGKSRKSLDLTQVDELFGERRDLILPIVHDIANIVTRSTNDRFVSPASEAESNESTDEGRSTIDTRHGRTKRSIKRDDKLSYHERKLNMTNFHGTAESNDQHAIESETRVHVSLPDSNISHAMTLEEIENLALSGLNGTLPFNGNGSSSEALPEPEMLIRPYRVRPKPISERFDNIYLYVVDYPINQIMGSINRHKYAMTALLADNTNEWRSRMQELEAKKRREDEDNNIPSSGMCQSIVRYARPQKARSASGEWKYIVNTGQHTQTLRLEKCMHAEQPCTYLTDNFSSRCAQIYNYHRLLSWDSKRGLHIDIFKVPTCCSCQIDGYREKFPPATHGTNDQEIFETRFSASDALYSLANNDYNDNDDDLSGDSTGSIYAPNGQHHTKKHRSDKRKTANKKRPVVPHPDSYLTPPSVNQVAEIDVFKRKQSIGAPSHRATDRKTSQPILIGNDEATEFATERSPPSKNGFTPMNVPPQKVTQPQQQPRLPPSKVLIKRVNYNYHPIIDFFFRDRALKAQQKSKDRSGQKYVP